MSITLHKRKDDFDFEDRIRESLVALGCNEMVNNPLIPKKDAEVTGSPIEIANPQSQDMAYLRTSLLVSALPVISNNIKKGEKDIAVFEIGNIFERIKENLNSFADFEEKKKVLLIITGKKQSRLWDSADIPIEERNSSEVTTIHGSHPVAPLDVAVHNPAFDVTPAELITGIITERGVFKPEEIASQFRGK